MYKNFTRRHKLDHSEADLKYEDLPRAFRFDLLKIVQAHCSEEMSTVREYCLYRGASISVNADYFQLHSVDDIQEYYTPDLFVDLLQTAEWHEVLSVVEFLIAEGPLSKDEVNEIFEYHNIGYEVECDFHEPVRVVVKYSALIEQNEELLKAEIPYQPVIDAITKAREALINPQEIDVAQSVSQSVNAVEAYLRGWLTDKSHKAATLGDAIKVINKHSLCPNHVAKALEQFYIYRNRTENVGHGAPQYAEITREDALLCNEMAISFINYFHRKSART